RLRSAAAGPPRGPLGCWSPNRTAGRRPCGGCQWPPPHRRGGAVQKCPPRVNAPPPPPPRHYAPTPNDAYVPGQLIDKFHLAEGLLLAGPVEPARKGSSGPRLAAVEKIEGGDPKQFRRRNWDEPTPIDPRRRTRPETGPDTP